MSFETSLNTWDQWWMHSD